MDSKPATYSTQHAKSLVKRLQEKPTSPAIINVSELLNTQGKQDKALKHLNAVKNIYSGSYRYNLVLARTFRDLKDFKNAKLHYELACKIAPQNQVALKELAELVSQEYVSLLSSPVPVSIETAEQPTETEAIATDTEIVPTPADDKLFEDDSPEESSVEKDELFLDSPEPQAASHDEKSEELFVEDSSQQPEPEAPSEAKEMTADELFMSESSSYMIEDEPGMLEDLGKPEETQATESADLLFSDDISEPIATEGSNIEEPELKTPEAPSDLFIESTEENLSTEAPEKPGEDFFAQKEPDSNVISSEKPFELPQKIVEQHIHEPKPAVEDQTPDVSKSESSENQPLTAQDAPNIFEQEEPSSSYDLEELNDLFIPEEESFGLEKQGDISSHDLLPSTINAEQLQREAIRMLEEEQGPIGFDPFQDFDSPTETEVPKNDIRDDLADLPPIVENDESSDEQAPTTPSPESIPEASMPETIEQSPETQREETSSDLFLDDRPSSSTIDAPNIPEDFNQNFQDEQIAEKKPQTMAEPNDQQSKDDDYNLDFDDDFEFKIDKKRLASALSKLADSGSEEKPTEKTPASHQESIEDIAASLSDAKFEPVQETEDPTPIQEQRAPFSDDEAIKTPTLSLAKIFYAQGAYAKAINVYKALIQKDPDNIADYEKAIEDIEQKMSES